jgi:hypothetical protein
MADVVPKKYAEMPSIELSDRIRNNVKYKNRLDDIFSTFVIAMFCSLFFGGLLVLSGLPIETLYVLVIIAMIGIVWFSIDSRKKLNEYFVESDEWVKYYTHEICFALNRCLESKAKTEQKKHRNEALKNVRAFLLYITRDWRIGAFKPAKLYVGDVITNFKLNLKKIQMVLKSDDKQLICKIEQTLAHLNELTKTFSIEDIKQINEEIAAIPFKKNDGININATILTPLKLNALRIVTIAILGIVSVGVGITLNYFSIDKNTSVVASITLFGILVATFLKMQHSKD